MLDRNGIVKIGDFGVSQIVTPGERMRKQCGTPAYIAPEILLGKGYFNFTADIWSAGVTLYTMLNGQIPFQHDKIEDLHEMIIDGQFEFQVENLSSEVKDLI